MCPSQVTGILTVLKPRALTLSKQSWVVFWFPQAVSLATPLTCASIWLPRFHPMPSSDASLVATLSGSPGVSRKASGSTPS